LPTARWRSGRSSSADTGPRLHPQRDARLRRGRLIELADAGQDLPLHRAAPAGSRSPDVPPGPGRGDSR
jgi:hypothetical protein